MRGGLYQLAYNAVVRVLASVSPTYHEEPLVRKLIFFGVIVVILAAGLFLDLRSRGLVWQVFWSLTGEEEPLAQIRGMVEYAGNVTRPQPQFDRLVPVNYAHLNPYGMNTFLQLEPDPAKVEQQLRQIKEAGFAWIRQEFTWEDIEIHGRGDFEDRRNIEAVGIVDAWAKYDRIVELAGQYGLQIQARIGNPPRWAQSSPEAGDMAPPLIIEDYVNFAAAVVERYRGRIRFYQVWNEPNIYPEWGEADANPEAYTALLCAAHNAMKSVDPDAVIISGALAPTIELGGRNLNDFIFLERMYAAGAGECFDVLSMQGYGLNSGPTDQRMRPITVNVGRNQYIRELMIAHGDAEKAIWLSEAAWNAVPTVVEHPAEIDARGNFGQVTLEQQARYMPLFYDRIRREWPYIGMVNYWFFTLPDNSRSGESFYYFRMAEPDYSAEKPRYTTLPVYDTMREYIAGDDHRLYYGVHQLDGHWLVESDGTSMPVDGAQFRKALSATRIHFEAYGTEVRLRWQGGNLGVSVGNETYLLSAPAGVWHETMLVSGLTQVIWDITLTSDQAVLFDAVTVDDLSGRHLVLGLLALVIVVIVASALFVVRRRKPNQSPTN